MGIVHHSNYIRFFEEARVDFLEQLGVGFRLIEAEGIGSPVLDLKCTYQSGAEFGDRLLIFCRLQAYDGLRLRFEYRILNAADRRIHAFGNSGHCFIDLSSGRPIALQRTRPELYERLHQAVTACNPQSLEEMINEWSPAIE